VRLVLVGHDSRAEEWKGRGAEVVRLPWETRGTWYAIADSPGVSSAPFILQRRRGPEEPQLEQANWKVGIGPAVRCAVAPGLPFLITKCTPH